MHTDKYNTKIDYLLIVFVVISFLVNLRFPQAFFVLWVAVLLGSLPTFWGALKSTLKGNISIDTFNVFAIIVSFAYGEVRSATFIILMLAFARLLNTLTESRVRRTIEELLKLKPQTALREKDKNIEEIPADNVVVGDILVVKEGARIPVDGIVTFGKAYINESSVTGESVPLNKIIGDHVLSSTLNESGLIKIKATHVGKDSTIEQITELVKEASKNKSRSEKLADRFASIYLPIVLAIGIAVYFITGNIEITAALFLVACADDVAVAVPLAITAAMGKSAKRGVLIKGGEWIESLSKINTLIVDKTGTLTYGTFNVKEIKLVEGISEQDFWNTVAIAEKYSEHPIGKTIFKEALKHSNEPADPDEFKIYKGSGVMARHNQEISAVGDYSIISDLNIVMNESEKKYIQKELEQEQLAKVVVLKNDHILGFISIGDTLRSQARQSILNLKKIGITDIRMFTGDNELVAKRIAEAMGIDIAQSSMMPKEKLEEIKKIIAQKKKVAMVGDGVNDAASLAIADVGIAMGSSGAAVSVEAADIVVLNDDLSRIPETLLYSRKVMSVIKWDIILWIISNAIGFTLVLTGVIGPALAAFYNFFSDFFPLLNSARLFREKT